MIAKTQNLLQKLKLEINPTVAISQLKVGQQQVVEIAKALLTDSQVIIMDEPTSAISDKEVAVLFSIINDLKREGKVVVYISHKLDELFKIADRYVVLRDGCSIESGEMNGMTQDRLIEKMVGREIQLIRRPVEEQTQKEVVLTTENVCLAHPQNNGQQLLKNISFQIRKGEIVGLFGLMGAGRTELMETLFGLHPKRMSGAIYIDSKQVNFRFPADAIKAGIALVPEDRKKDGLVLGLPVRTNISLTVLDEMGKAGFLENSKEADLSKKYINELRIKTATDKVLARSLSGGNQQKIVLAKWLAKHPKVLLLDEPTRGVDINAKNEIYKLIVELAGKGLAIIMVSSELPEIFAVSDRVLVLSEGTITAEIPIATATESIILKAAIPKTI